MSFAMRNHAPKIPKTEAGAMDSSHPFADIARFALAPKTGVVITLHLDGSVQQGNIGGLGGNSRIEYLLFRPPSSILEINLDDGAKICTQIDTVSGKVDRPVVYLDQKDWIELARVQAGSRLSSPAAEHRASCEELIAMAQDEKVILPLSAAHVVETGRAGGKRRRELATTMLSLSRGWQMRHPIDLRRIEFTQMFSTEANAPLSAQDVFSLGPEALWANFHDGSSQQGGRRADAQTEVEGLMARINWAAALTDVMLEETPESAPQGLDLAERWSTSLHGLALHMRGNSHARPYIRDLTRARYISDAGEDLPRAAMEAGLTPNDFAVWLSNNAEADISRLPSTGRYREILHLRLANADDGWTRNDLYDMLFLGAAAGYADVVVGERKMCSYLSRVQNNVSAGAEVYRKIVDALPAIRAAIDARP